MSMVAVLLWCRHSYLTARTACTAPLTALRGPIRLHCLAFDVRCERFLQLQGGDWSHGHH